MTKIFHQFQTWDKFVLYNNRCWHWLLWFCPSADITNKRPVSWEKLCCLQWNNGDITDVKLWHPQWMSKRTGHNDSSFCLRSPECWPADHCITGQRCQQLHRAGDVSSSGRGGLQGRRWPAAHRYVGHIHVTRYHRRNLNPWTYVQRPWFMMVYLCQKRVFATRCNYLQRVAIK